MNDFIQWRDWWSAKYRFPIGEGVRYFSFKTALNIFHQRGGMNMVETGTVRARDDMAGGGASTVILGDYAQRYDKKFWSVDILPEAIALSKELTEGFNHNTTHVLSDSILFLHTFKDPIDFLYLDSMDCPENDAPDSPRLLESQKHQVRELETAWKNIHKRSVILLDDNNFENGGKCRFSIQFLEQKGWLCLINDKQSLWIYEHPIS